MNATISNLIEGIEHYKQLTGHMPTKIVMTRNQFDQLQHDTDFLLCRKCEDPNAEAELMGVKITVDNSNPATRII